MPYERAAGGYMAARKASKKVINFFVVGLTYGCVNYGRRVQNSVFECILDSAQCVRLKALLIEIIDEKKDSLRFYYLGNNYKTKVEHVGVERGIAVDDVLIL